MFALLLFAVCAVSSVIQPLETKFLGVELNQERQVAPGVFRSFVSEHNVELSVEAEHAPHRQLHSIHSFPPLSHLYCQQHLRWKLVVPATAVLPTIVVGDVVVGEHACFGEEEGTETLMARVTFVRKENDVTLVIGVEKCGLQDIFKNAKVHLKMPLPGRHRPAEEGEKQKETTTAKRGVGSWLRSVWGDITHLAEEIESIVHNAATAALTIEGGELQIDKEWTKPLYSWNFDYSTSQSKGKVSINSAISCDNCYAHLDAALSFSLLIEDYKLIHCDTAIHGTMHAGLGAHASVSGDVHAKVNLGTYDVPRISFVVGGFPVTVKVTVPMTLGADVTASVSSKFTQSVKGSGDVHVGVRWQSSDQKFHPYAGHSLSFSGLSQGTVGGKVDAIVWIRPVLVANINFIGGPSFTVRPYAECVVEYPGGCRAGEELQLTVNAGVQGIVGASLDIKLGSKDLIKRSMKPYPVLSEAWGIESKCLHLKSDPEQVLREAMLLESGNNQSVSFLPGAIWHGESKLVDFSPVCEDKYAHSVDLSLQLLSLNGTEASFLLAGNAMDVVETAQNTTTPGFCMFQQLYAGVVANSTVRLTEMIMDQPGNFYGCSLYFPVKPQLMEWRFLDEQGFQLTGVHDDNCTISVITAPDN